MDAGLRVRLLLRWMKLKKRSNARNAANWSKPAWLVREICNPCSKSCAAQRKSGVTILVPVARERNIRSAAGPTLSPLFFRLGNHKRFHNNIIRLQADWNHSKQGILTRLELGWGSLLDYRDVAGLRVQNQ